MISTNVLIVEDDPDYQWLVASFLKDNGCTVSTANDGEVAWNMIQSLATDFDFIITDNIKI